MAGVAGAERILRGTPHTLKLTLEDAAGAPVTPASGTITVETEGGTTLVAAQAITAADPSTYALTAANTVNVARLIATWTVSVGGSDETHITHHEIVGELLFSQVEARLFDNAALTSETTYLDATILQGRDRIHDAFESITRTGIGGRYEREVLNGGGNQELWLRHRRIAQLLSVGERAIGASTFTAYNAAALADILVEGSGKLWRETLGSFAAGRQNVQIEYEHGLQPIPEALRRAALIVLRHELVYSNIDRRVTRLVDATGSWEVSTPGQRGAWYGIPEVDVVLNLYRGRHRVVAIA